MTKKMSKSEIADLYKRLKPSIQKEFQPPYSLWAVKTSECTITAYQSGKVLFQGNDLSWLEEDGNSSSSAKKSSGTSSKSASLESQVPSAGSDEVGTGDYFGPLTVAAVIVETMEQAQALKNMGITDSKALSDEFIRKAAPKIKEMVPYTIQILEPSLYNKTWRQPDQNLNWIKSQMHNKAYLNLQAKGNKLPSLKVVDQFCVPSSFYKHLRNTKEVLRDLHFETKAESKYIAVAAASVLARNAFLECFDKMEEKYNFHFAKGGGAQADVCAKKFVEEFGWEEMSKVAKMHFSNTQKVRKALGEL